MTQRSSPAPDPAGSRVASRRSGGEEAVSVAGPLGWATLARTTALRAAHPARTLVYAANGRAPRSPIAALQLALFDVIAAGEATEGERL